MKHSKLIRGVIYDNPNLVEEKTYETAEVLSIVTDNAGSIYDREMPGDECPSKDEFMVSMIIDAICEPSPDQENMIIPSSLVDHKLYNQLKKIDIGEELSMTYNGLREAKFLEQEKENSCPCQEFTPFIHFSCNSKDEFLEKLSELHESGILPSELCIDIVNRINQVT